MGVVRYIGDRLINLVSKMGTDRDKAASTTFGEPLLLEQDARNAYRGNWLAQKIVNIIPDDACSEWRSWQAKGVDISAIEREESRHNVTGKVLQAMKLGRQSGGAALLIGVGQTDMSKPLDPATVKRGGLQYVAMLSKQELAPGELDRDLASPYFNQPSYYTLSLAQADPVVIHPSRLVIFTGVPALHPDHMNGHEWGWGDSILTAVADPIKDAGGVWSNLASLVFEAKVDVFSIPDFMAQLEQNGQQFETTVLNRFRLANTSKGINGALLLDAAETYTQKQVNFTNFPEVLMSFLQLVSGAADIPMTRLLGQSPAGMNATGESDMANYNRRVRSIQKNDMGPRMAILDECLIRSAMGDRPPEVFYLWNPLTQPTSKEKAEEAKIYADAAEKDVTSGLVPLDALAIGRQNQLVELGTYPGLEQALAESRLAAAALEGEETPPEDADDATAIETA